MYVLPYWFYNIRRELVDVSSIIIYFPSTFCPTLGHHQGRIYNKSDVTFVFALLLCKKKSVCTVAVCSVYFEMCFYKWCQYLKTFKYISTGLKINFVKPALYIPNMCICMYIYVGGLVWADVIHIIRWLSIILPICFLKMSINI